MRRLLALVKGLPSDSALMREVEPDSWWTQDTELLASAVEGIFGVIRLLHTANFKKPHPEPLQIPRPWDGKKEQPKGTTMDELRQMVAPITPRDSA